MLSGSFGLALAGTSVPPSPGGSPTGQPTPSPGPAVPPPPPLDISGSDAIWLIGGVVIIIALSAFVPLALDARRASRWRDSMSAWVQAGTLSGRDLRAVLAEIGEPRGVRGLTRSTIALLIIVLAALALAVTLVAASADAGDLRKTIVTSLMTVLATVAGFYFGSRVAQTSVPRVGPKAAGNAGTAKLPTVTRLDPNAGSPGQKVDVTGANLSRPAAVLFGATPGANVTSTDDSHLSVEAPPQPSGALKTVNVIVVTSNGASAPTASSTFTYA